MAAQNQHYVPKFILRQFLSDQKNKRVSVYDKHTDKTFVTSIKNVMAERRFNDFYINDDWIVSFEPVACAAEDLILPAYQQVLAERRISNSPEQKAALAVFIAFQFLRTKSSRDRWLSLEEVIVSKVEALGGKMQDVKGWECWQPSDENTLKQEHLNLMRSSLNEVALIIAAKDFALIEAAAGRTFYLGDNPVCLSNSRESGLRGNIGLAVDGIEIYMPLSADLMLCAWCPSLLNDISNKHHDAKRKRRAWALSQVIEGELTSEGMKSLVAEYEQIEYDHDELLSATSEGRPVSSDDANMDFYNSLQTSYAYRYVVCSRGDFQLARLVNRENPEQRRGYRLSAADA